MEEVEDKIKLAEMDPSRVNSDQVNDGSTDSDIEEP